MIGVELSTLAGKKALGIVGKKFSKHVVERWTRYRAERFFEGFVQAIAGELNSGQQTDDVDQALDRILADEARSELLFEAYRTICFSQSKTLRPRIIGLLTGSLVSEGRMADESEQMMFSAAEDMSDPDLVGFYKEFKSYSAKADNCKNPKKEPSWVDDALSIPCGTQTEDSGGQFFADKEIYLTSFDCEHWFSERWARKAEAIGLLSSATIKRSVEYREDSERRIYEDGVLTLYESSIRFEPPCRKLCALIERALGPSEGGKEESPVKPVEPG